MTKKKKLLIIFITIIAIILILLGVAYYGYTQGVLVKPSEEELALMAEVPHEDILEFQTQREQQILDDYNGNVYSMHSPYVIVDPYEFNPLSALVIFDESYSSDITVTIDGKDEYSTIEYVHEVDNTHYEIPIIGLYPDTHNKVHLVDENGNYRDLTIVTEPLPVDFEVYELVESQPEKMEPGITLFTACFEHSYNALLDCNADVRGYISNQRMAHGTSMSVLENGHMLSTGDEYRYFPYNMMNLYEYNWLGKIFTEYRVPNGIHHDVREMSDGNFIATSNRYDMFEHGTNEDVVIIIDRNTGEIIKEYDYNDIVDNTREMYHHFEQHYIMNAPMTDWLHMNSATYDEENNTIITSSAIQSQVTAIDADTSEIRWILGPHENYNGSSEFMAEYLLEPIGDGFEWQWCQHQPTVLPDMDNNPETIDIILFDNGQNKSSTMRNAVPADENYSRGVIYRINESEMTVEQVWQYGKSRGSVCYSTFLGDANYNETTGNRMMCFGGQLREGNKPIDDIVSGAFAKAETVSRIVEVTALNEVVYEVRGMPSENDISGETYQAKRIPFYIPSAFDYQLGEITPERLGDKLCDGFVINKEFAVPNLFTDTISVEYNSLYQKDDRLIIDMLISDGDHTPTMSRCYAALISADEKYGFVTRGGLWGRTYCNIDLSQLPAGEYLLSFYGGVSDDNDPLTAEWTKGHYNTGYKITIN